MASKETYRICVRIPADQYRMMDVLLRKPENAHFETNSDLVRFGIELAIITASRNVPDPDWQQVAEDMIKKRKQDAEVAKRRLREEVLRGEWLAESYRRSDNQRSEGEGNKPSEPTT